MCDVYCVRGDATAHTSRFEESFQTQLQNK